MDISSNRWAGVLCNRKINRLNISGTAHALDRLLSPMAMTVVIELM
jgi:hypothetical protein